MAIGKLLKRLLLLPAQAAVLDANAKEQAAHATRRKLGNPEKRSLCCGPRPESFAIGLQVKDIPELRDILEQTSSFWRGLVPFYCCKACGQEWWQTWEPQKSGGEIRVLKAT